ncbi:MAG: hypothetical protein JWL81_207 [Verrucomicrobiales bacterium]|nr:hypothetical protein [Verrucomicrobiales bacterium]
MNKLYLLALAALPLLASTSQAAVYSGNGNTGFGGVIDSLNITDDGTTLTFVLTRGPASLNDSFVLYIDSVAGGFSDTSGFTDATDSLRGAISGKGTGGGTSVATFPSGITPDHAIGLEASFSGVWALNNAANHTFISTANAAPGGTGQTSYTMTVTLANLGLTPGAGFSFVGTYLNSGNAFRSNEGIGGGLPGSNPGATNVTFTSALSYVTIPEPTASSLSLTLGLASLLQRRRRA